MHAEKLFRVGPYWTERVADFCNISLEKFSKRFIRRRPALTGERAQIFKQFAMLFCNFIFHIPMSDKYPTFRIMAL